MGSLGASRYGHCLKYGKWWSTSDQPYYQDILCSNKPISLVFLLHDNIWYHDVAIIASLSQWGPEDRFSFIESHIYIIYIYVYYIPSLNQSRSYCTQSFYSHNVSCVCVSQCLFADKFNSTSLACQVSPIHCWVRAWLLTIITHMEIFLKWRYPKIMIVSMLKKSSMTWMIWGSPILGNHHKPPHTSWNASPWS
jgi:hypothetical protein